MQKRTVWGRSLALWCALGMLHCSGQTADLGSNAASLAGESGAGYQGTWVGTLSSGLVVSSKALRLEIDGDGVSTLLVGDEPLGLPTDPSIAYPPEAEVDAGQSTSLRVRLYDGVVYTLQNIRVVGSTLELRVDAWEPFVPWCELQAPPAGQSSCREDRGIGVERSGGGKQCYYWDGVIDDDATEKDWEDCLIVMLCGGSADRRCECTASSCTLNDGEPGLVGFELHLDQAGDTLVGTYFTDPSSSLAVQIPYDDRHHFPITFTRLEE